MHFIGHKQTDGQGDFRESENNRQSLYSAYHNLGLLGWGCLPRLFSGQTKKAQPSTNGKLGFSAHQNKKAFSKFILEEGLIASKTIGSID